MMLGLHKLYLIRNEFNIFASVKLNLLKVRAVAVIFGKLVFSIC